MEAFLLGFSNLLVGVNKYSYIMGYLGNVGPAEIGLMICQIINFYRSFDAPFFGKLGAGRLSKMRNLFSGVLARDFLSHVCCVVGG